MMLPGCHRSKRSASVSRFTDHYVISNVHQVDPLAVVCGAANQNSAVMKKKRNHPLTLICHLLLKSLETRAVYTMTGSQFHQKNLVEDSPEHEKG
jgi:hypothetical protein